MNCENVGRYIEEAGQGLGPEEGFRFGNPQAEVGAILISWMATTKAISRAIDEGCNLMIVHEDLFYPYEFQRKNFETCLTWSVNRKRIKMLSENDITVFRAHGTLDRICILDMFGETLGLAEPVVKHGYIRVFDVPEIEACELASKIKEKLNLETIRLVGKTDRRVRRIGLPWGGLGLSLNVGFIEDLLKYKPDALVAGETDEYVMFYILDADVTMIETGHTVSENIGLKRFAETLKDRYPDTKTIFFECERPWKPL